jgi:hypothetical protein
MKPSLISGAASALALGIFAYSTPALAACVPIDSPSILMYDYPTAKVSRYPDNPVITPDQLQQDQLTACQHTFHDATCVEHVDVTGIYTGCPPSGYEGLKYGANTICQIWVLYCGYNDEFVGPKGLTAD